MPFTPVCDAWLRQNVQHPFAQTKSENSCKLRVLMTTCVVQPLSISLHGITNDGVDPGVDVWQQVTLPIIRQLADIEKDGLQMKVGHAHYYYAGTWASFLYFLFSFVALF